MASCGKEIRKPNPEARMKAEFQSPKAASELRSLLDARRWQRLASLGAAFGLRVSDFFRPSELGIRPSLLFLVLVMALAPLSACSSRRVHAYPVLPETARDLAPEARARETLAHLFPPQYRATQRAIITVGHRQFVCDGVLTASPEKGLHLAIISTLGLVTELEVSTNNTSRVLRITPLFRPDWSRQFVAEDLQRLFMAPRNLEVGGRLADGRFVLETPPGTQAQVARYIFSRNGDRLEEVEVACQGRRIYHASMRRYQKFAGWAGEVPAEFTVTAPNYQLELRTAELVVSAPASLSAGR